MPELSWQASLFDCGVVAVDPAFAGLRRIRLDDESWVDHVPGWLSGSDDVFATLLAAGDWRQRQRWMYDKMVVEPRLTAGFGIGDDDSRPSSSAATIEDDEGRDVEKLYPDGEIEDLAPDGDAGTAIGHVPARLGEICRTLSRRYDVDFDRVWVNLYRDGADSVAWHRDRNGRVQRNPLVATVSLGAQRKFQLRRKGETRIRHQLRPGPGDLIVMGGACQHSWEHCVPKTRHPVGPRMSVTIRHSLP